MAFSHTSRNLSLALAGLALATTAACADVGSSSSSGSASVQKSADQDTVICNSIRAAMQRDKKAAEQAAAKGDKAGAGQHNEAVLAGAEGAKSVKGCNVSDLVPGAAGAPTPRPSS